MRSIKGEAGVAPSPLQQGYLFYGGKKLLKRFGAKRQSNYDEIKGEAGVAPSPLQQGYLFCGGKKLLKRFGAKRHR